MRYEIQVTVNGVHLFTTAERSLTTYGEAVTAFNLLREQLAYGKMPTGAPRYEITLFEISEVRRPIG